MPNDPKIYRNIPFRPYREKVERGHLWRLVSRVIKEYCRGYRLLLLGCVILQILSGFTSYALFFSTRHVVNNVLVVEQLEAEPLGEPSAHEPVLSPTAAAGSLESDHEVRLDRGGGTERELWTVCALFVIVVVILNICGRTSRRLRVVASLRIFGHLREVLHRKILALDYENYQAQTPGKLMSYIINDINALDRLFVQALVMLACEFSMICVGMVVLFIMHWQMALMAVALLPLHALLYLRVKGPQRAASRELRHTNACLWSFSTQRLNGIKTVMAYSREGHEAYNFLRLGICYLRDALLVSRCSALINCNAWLIMGLGTGSVLVISTHLVLGGKMTLGDMVMFHGIVAFLFARIVQLSNLNAWFANISAVLNRVYRVLDMPIQIRDREGSKPLAEPVQGKVEFRDVTFDYPQSSRPAMKGLSITIEPGEWICLMGPSGSGKSTFVSLLTRIHEPQQGEILVDGQALDRVQLASLRKNMVLVPQEPQIFSGTVADNICYGSNEYSPSKIMAVAEAAELHETIMALPAKYETVLGEKGISLSGGQRQRLSLARALITDPHILILDDCTSALDAKTEKRIQGTLRKIMAGRTAIIVSQRVSMAQCCGKVLVLEDGKVAECGTPAELLKNGRFYAQMHRRQTGSAGA